MMMFGNASAGTALVFAGAGSMLAVALVLLLSSPDKSVAYQGFAENTWGRISAGATADFVQLDRDPRVTPPLELPTVGVRATYLMGRPAYSATN